MIKSPMDFSGLAQINSHESIYILAYIRELSKSE